MKINVLVLVAILFAGLFFESCRPPRCPLAYCHVRMKHRHPSMDGEGGFNPDANIDPRTGEALSASGGGKVYRGVPFYERNKNPKIAHGYKEGYKYRHRKQKPLTAAELKKIEEKRNREQEKLDRKSGKSKPEEKTEGAPEGEGEVQTEAGQEGEPQAETKAEKRRRKKESRRKAREEKETQGEEKPAEEAPRPQPPPKPATDDKKDGF